MPNVSKNKILITGASGMLGISLMKRFSNAGETFGVSKSGRNNTIICDLSDESQVKNFFDRQRPSLVIHSAAYSDVDGCERDPKLAHESNALATKYLAAACSAAKAPLVYVSTDYVFDGRERSLYAETHPTSPVNIYGITKLEGEYYARQCFSSSVIVRTSWLFGVGSPNNFVNAIIERLQKENVVAVLDDQEDSPTYVEDLAEAIEKISEHLLKHQAKDAANPVHEIFHVCNSGSATRYGMTLKIKEWLHLKNVRVEKIGKSQIKNRLAIRPAYSVMSTERYRKFFNTRLRRWEDSLREYLNEYVQAL